MTRQDARMTLGRVPIALATLALLAMLPIVVPGHASADPAPGYRFGSGDVLEVEFYASGQRQDQFTVTVAPDGAIDCPLLGAVHAGGRTSEEVGTEMRERLARDYYVSPQVILRIRDYGGRVFVGGEVRQPGAFGYQQGLTVLDVCLLAGGFTDLASLRHVKVFHAAPAGARPLDIDLTKVRAGKSHDLALQIGDRVEVPRRRF